MSIAARIGLSALIASAVPALPFFVISLLAKGDTSSLVVGVIAWSISAAHVLVLGVPAFVTLQHKQLANRWSLLLAGLVLGAAPVALASLPSAIRGGTFDFSAPLVFGVLGAFSAWVFWVAWCRLGPNNSFKPKPLRGSA